MQKIMIVIAAYFLLSFCASTRMYVADEDCSGWRGDYVGFITSIDDRFDGSIVIMTEDKDDPERKFFISIDDQDLRLYKDNVVYYNKYDFILNWDKGCAVVRGIWGE